MDEQRMVIEVKPMSLMNIKNYLNQFINNGMSKWLIEFDDRLIKLDDTTQKIRHQRLSKTIYEKFEGVCVNRDLEQTFDPLLLESDPDRYTNRADNDWTYDKGSLYDNLDEPERISFRLFMSSRLFPFLN